MAPREEDLVDEDPPSINPYEVLGLEKTASVDEVKSAYRKAALKHHPGMKVTRSQLQLPHEFISLSFHNALITPLGMTYMLMTLSHRQGP
jgi:DnaJ homolog subfamily C member 9